MIAASNHILGSAWYLYEVYVDTNVNINVNLQRKLLRVKCYHGASSMTTHEKHGKLNHIHLCLGLINIHSKCFHRTYTGYKCTWKNKHTVEFWSTTNCRWNAEQLMVNSRLRVFPPLLLSERQRQNALPQQIITNTTNKCAQKDTFHMHEGVIHISLIWVGSTRKNTSTSLRNMMEWKSSDSACISNMMIMKRPVRGNLESNLALTWMRNVENQSTPFRWQTRFCWSWL